MCAQLCSTLCDPMDCNPPGSSVHGILQARILGWVAMPFSRGSFQLRDQIQVSWIGKQILYHWATWEVQFVAAATEKKHTDLGKTGWEGQALDTHPHHSEAVGWSCMPGGNRMCTVMLSGMCMMQGIGRRADGEERPHALNMLCSLFKATDLHSLQSCISQFSKEPGQSRC